MVIAMLSQPNPIHPPDGWRSDDAFSVELRRLDQETAVVVLRGEADISTRSSLRQIANEAADGGPQRVIVDLDGLTFLDAVTLDWLAETRNRLSVGGATLQVSCHTLLGRRLLTATGLDFLLT